MTDDRAAQNQTGGAPAGSSGDAAPGAQGAAQHAQAQAEGAAQHVQSKAGGAAQEVRGRAEEVREKVKTGAKDARDRAQREAEQGFERGKGRVAQRVSSVAHAFRKTGEQLREEEQEDLAGYTDRIAEQVERVSGYLEGKGLRDVLDDVSALARQQPGLFVGGALVAGLVAARFLRSSGSHGGDTGFSSDHDPYR